MRTTANIFLCAVCLSAIGYTIYATCYVQSVTNIAMEDSGCRYDLTIYKKDRDYVRWQDGRTTLPPDPEGTALRKLQPARQWMSLSEEARNALENRKQNVLGDFKNVESAQDAREESLKLKQRYEMVLSGL